MELVLKGLFNQEPKTITRFLLLPDSFMIEDDKLMTVRKKLVVILLDRFIESLEILTLSPKHTRYVSNFVKILLTSMSDEDYGVPVVINDQSKVNHFLSRIAKICTANEIIMHEICKKRDQTN